MRFSERSLFIAGTVVSIVVIIIFVIWAEMDLSSLLAMSKEDGPLENLTAILFGLSSICFIVFAKRSDFLKNKLAYVMTIGWVLLMFVFMGEEISWGQRIFSFATPEKLAEINKQDELNIHNIEKVDTFAGGKYRYLSIMMLTIGLLLPLFALMAFGKRTIQRFAFPVTPFCYSALFVGAYLFGKHYQHNMGNGAAEVREFLMSFGMFCFAMHGGIYPCTLFRIRMPKEKVSNN